MLLIDHGAAVPRRYRLLGVNPSWANIRHAARIPAKIYVEAVAKIYVEAVTGKMHIDVMKTVTFTIPEELDAQAVVEARRCGVSQSELIRLGFGAVISTALAEPGDNPWLSLAGFGSDDISVEAGEIDDVVYRG